MSGRASDRPQRERPAQTAVDYVTIVLSPFLIMGLVGSLVFFLIEILYKSDGPWKERLQWVLFFYVFGSVLTARIAMQSDIASRSSLYGAVLALLTYLGMQAYVEYPEGVRPISFLFNLFLVALVWWCAQRLTWDCTNVDEKAEMNSAGLLQVSGVESAHETQEVTEAEEEVPPSRVKMSGFEDWWRRYQLYRDKQSKKRTLGVWVVYFALAALPIFGLGQALLPLSSPERRRFCFWQMTIYVGCSLGLLLTTCFLGLRRYLRQKNLQMPATMTRSWLALGGILILALLIVGAVLPRPYSETSLLDVVRRAGSPQRKASDLALKGDSPAEGKGNPGEARSDPKAKGDKSADKGKDPGNKDKDGKGNKDGKDGKSSDSRDKSDKSDKGDKNDKNDKSDKSKSEQGKQSGEAKKEPDSDKNRDQNQSARQQSTNKVAEVLQKIGPWLKWIVFGALAIIVGIALFRGGLGFLANFTDWARRWLDAWKKFWEGLFGSTKVEPLTGQGGVAEESKPLEKIVPFSAFANPFENGKAARLDSVELIRYSFRALEAWARERDCGRDPDETAQEFIARLGDEIPTLEQEAQQLGQLQAWAEYSKGNVPAGAVETVRRFWVRLEKVTQTPLSA